MSEAETSGGGRGPSGRPNAIREADPDGGAPARRASAGDPASVRLGFYVEVRPGGERLYWADHGRRDLALRATRAAVETRREDRATVAAALDLAAARGWRAVELSGSAAFRREAWIEAAARGVEARGHAPSGRDREEAERRRADRAPPGRAPRGAPPTAAGGRASPWEAAARELSPDGRLLMAALESKIGRELRGMSAEGVRELRDFAAAELARREARDGPVRLSDGQRRAAAAPEPPRGAPGRRDEPDPPRRAVPGR